jgi:hypothetical protein
MNKQRQQRQQQGHRRHGLRAVGQTLAAIALAAIVVWAGTGLLLRMARRDGPRLQRYITPPVDARGTRVQLQGPPGWRLSPLPHRGKGARPLTTAAFVLTPGDPLAAWPVWLRPLVPRWWVPKVEKRAVLFLTLGPMSTATWSGLYDGRLSPRSPSLVFRSPTKHRPHGRPRPFGASRGVSSPDRRYWLRVNYYRENETAFKDTYAPICHSLRFLEPAHNIP